MGTPDLQNLVQVRHRLLCGSGHLASASAQFEMLEEVELHAKLCYVNKARKRVQAQVSDGMLLLTQELTRPWCCFGIKIPCACCKISRTALQAKPTGMLTAYDLSGSVQG